MTRPDPDRPAWLDRHTLAVDIAANWCGLTLLLAAALTLLSHEAAGPGFWPILAAVAAGRAVLEGALPWTVRRIHARRATP